jgi:peptidoglycan/xylan/chitin deacetylase (PgdA/CDA1 family)
MTSSTDRTTPRAFNAAPEQEHRGESRRSRLSSFTSIGITIMSSISNGLCSLVFAFLFLGLPIVGVAKECPGNPSAIGTSRVISVDPAKLPEVGTEQFEATLPLNDHEVVLSFDDGPSRAHTGKILDELAAQCVKANFFIVGEMANNFPEAVRRESREGHTVGFHTQTHPHLPQLPLSNAQRDVEQGIASVIAALGDARAAAPFIRAPYFEMTAALQKYFAERHLMTWGDDFDSDDWMDISPKEVVDRALKHIEEKGRGVLLMHDIQERTTVALPMLLDELKQRGYRIVHVIPAPTEPLSPAPVVAQHSDLASRNPAAERAASPSARGASGNCANDPNVLGTSRVISVDPQKLTGVGTVQFPETLPLNDRELVLTFDDGPLPPFTNQILDTLASQCIKATFFVVGEMAKDSPDVVRREYDEGHTIGTLTESHSDLSELPLAEARKEIETGIASAKAALGPLRSLAPFFRHPYLHTNSAIEDYLRSQHIMTWSIDFEANDWMDISPDEVVEHALNEIERNRKGILELYDIQERTAIALPKLLSELKRRGYRIVHVTAGPTITTRLQ